MTLAYTVPSRPVTRRPLAIDLARNPEPLERWLWCLHCERFFQVKHLRFDLRQVERCPFDDCTGAGLDEEIFLWDDWREPNDPRWPSSESELYVGQRSPEIASIRDAPNLEATLREFERSVEIKELGAPALGARWTREALTLLDWWGVEPREIDTGRLGELLSEFPDWVACAPWDAGDIVRELGAFFRWAAGRGAMRFATDCARYLAHPSVQLELGRTIRKHRRRRRPR